MQARHVCAEGSAIMKTMRELETLDEHIRVLAEYDIDLNNIVNPQLCAFNPGEFICEDGEEMQDLFFLLEGSVKTLIPAKEKAGFALGRYMGRGVFDDTLLMREDNISHVRAVCETDVKAIALPLLQNRAVLLGQPAFIMYLAKGYASFIDQSMNSFFFKKYPMEVMLCSYIAAKRTDLEWVPDWDRCAKDLATTPRILMRCMGMLLNKGILKKGEKGYMIADPILFEEYNRGIFATHRRRKHHDE